MIPTGELQRCSDLFLEAAFDSEKLGAALLLAANLFGGEAAQIITLNNRGDLLSSVSTGMDLNEVSKQTAYLDISPRIKALKALKEGEITFDYASIHKDSIATDPTYQELLKPNDVDWYAGTTLVRNNEMNMGFALFRNDAAGHYSKKELKNFKWLTERISESAKLNVKLDALKLNVNYDVLESCFAPVATLSVDRRILEMSDTFHEVLKTHKLGKLNFDGRLTFNNPLVEAQLKATVPIYTDNFSSYKELQNTNEILLKSPEGVWVALKLHPILPKSRWANIGAVALLTFREVSSPSFDSDYLRALFGLTKAEAEIAGILAMGKSMKETSLMRHISYETARFHAKSIYSKVGCKSQVELVFLLNRLFQ